MQRLRDAQGENTPPRLAKVTLPIVRSEITNHCELAPQHGQNKLLVHALVETGAGDSPARGDGMTGVHIWSCGGGTQSGHMATALIGNVGLKLTPSGIVALARRHEPP